MKRFIRWFRISRTNIALASIASGFITSFVGATFIYPESRLYKPDDLWVGWLTIGYGLLVVFGNIYYLLKDRNSQDEKEES